MCLLWEVKDFLSRNNWFRNFVYPCTKMYTFLIFIFSDLLSKTEHQENLESILLNCTSYLLSKYKSIHEENRVYWSKISTNTKFTKYLPFKFVYIAHIWYLLSIHKNSPFSIKFSTKILWMVQFVTSKIGLVKYQNF